MRIYARSLKKERSCCEEASSSRLRCTCRIIIMIIIVIIIIIIIIIKELIADTVTIIVPL